MRTAEEKYLKEVFSGIIIHVPASVKKRGVLTGISKKLKWQKTAIMKETEGQFLIIQGCMLLGMKWTPVGVYVPQAGKTLFF